MRRSLGLCAVLSVSVLGLPAAGQEGAGNVALIHCADVQGDQGRYEDGVKKHMDWHRKQKDTWSWVSWTTMTGRQSGRRCSGTFGHKWEDFDKPTVSMAADSADAGLNFGAFIANHEAAFWTRLADVSRPAAEPAPMESVVLFRTRFGTGPEFQSLIGEFHRAIEKTNMPWRYDWYALANGGESGTYALVLPLADFAAFAPSGKPLREMLTEAYGKTAADAILDRWNEVVTGTESQLIVFRPDLSYVPAP